MRSLGGSSLADSNKVLGERTTRPSVPAISSSLLTIEQEKSFAAIVVERAVRTIVFVISRVMLSMRLAITPSVTRSIFMVVPFGCGEDRGWDQTAAAVAHYDAKVAAYRRTVLTAFADSLVRTLGGSWDAAR